MAKADLDQSEAVAGLQRLALVSNGEDASEDAFQAEVSRIYQQASATTKPFYDRGAMSSNGEMTDNWIIRWLLWQAMHQPNGR